MERAQRDFAYFWKLSGLTDKVFYHVGIGFECTGGDILIIDESDTLIFEDPEAFDKMMDKNRCICLTATPDDNDRKGAEKQVITALKLTKYLYGFTAEDFAQAKLDLTLTLADNSAILAFLREEIRLRPVLFYCSEEAMQYIVNQEQAFIHAKGVESDDALRNLDQRATEDSYSLVIATTAEAMRGIDYRAPTVGITLIIGKSSANARDGKQKLLRVGR
jgi:late competence protein required for DNA uptake (superfamily II DNA/RNA helicase)